MTAEDAAVAAFSVAPACTYAVVDPDPADMTSADGPCWRVQLWTAYPKDRIGIPPATVLWFPQDAAAGRPS